MVLFYSTVEDQKYSIKSENKIMGKMSAFFLEKSLSFTQSSNSAQFPTILITYGSVFHNLFQNFYQCNNLSIIIEMLKMHVL